MSQHMLTIASHEAKAKDARVHLLPCRIHHDGDVDSAAPYWSPAENSDGSKVAYLRGRKLRGKAVTLPEGYYGSVAEKGDKKREIPGEDGMDRDADVEELPEAIEVARLNGKAQFDEFVIWGHESTADSSADPYVRSIEEWVSFAEQIHAYPSSRDECK
ncbi:hypothetical protein JX265_011258 [Neoarthrinium moseri]|uniref:Uncharacterized protein n=1 Tax=Neoarthrinium moseri TaxID=1658444 RepID=A0A9P9WCQ4_9PEZI|nr:uncharacterized protein JN550_010564 [Neoarthrinium moseri]KAI1845847.1 hypothetical protein JX266_007934 [Neoarthrinium moseri]KAI1857523.1 hypothetical protein JX265_011258 [Neoarthrinium moseri]KAI1862099.1 hypothetical protein JN550_010564 [Neoarthrinium moseri]